MEVRLTYHISGHMLGEYSLKFRPKIYGIGTSNKSVPGMAIEIIGFIGFPNGK